MKKISGIQYNKNKNKEKSKLPDFLTQISNSNQFGHAAFNLICNFDSDFRKVGQFATLEKS